jgi:hypothetical protein
MTWDWGSFFLGVLAVFVLEGLAVIVLAVVVRWMEAGETRELYHEKC